MMRRLNITKRQVKWLLIILGIVAVVIAMLICLGFYAMIDDDKG